MQKKILITTLILSIIALISVIYKNYAGSKIDPKIGQTVVSNLFGDQFDSLEITSGSSTILLKNIENAWKIIQKDYYQADINKISKLLEKLNTAKIINLITKDKAKQADLKLSKKTGTILRFLKKGQPIYEIIIGKEKKRKPSANPNYYAEPSERMYIRYLNEDAAYLINQHFYIDQTPENWIQEQLVRISKNEIKKINVTTKNKKKILFTLAKKEKDKSFDLVKPKKKKSQKLNESTIKTFASSFEDIKIDDVIPAKKFNHHKNITDPIDIQIELFDKTKLTVTLNQKPFGKNEQYYLLLKIDKFSEKDLQWKNLHTLTQNWVYIIDKWKAKKWLKTHQDFLKK